MITEQTKLSPLFAQRIQALHDDKIAINDAKIKHIGHINIDDHGFIHYPDFSFTPEYNDPSGILVGPKAIGENFRRLLGAMPKYVNPNSALGTCWVGGFPAKFGFTDKDKPVHLADIVEYYKILQPGCGGMNHLCPDMNIGLSLGWGGLLEKIRYFRQFNNPVDTGFYNGEEQLVLGVQEWVGAHAGYARMLAAEEADEIKKQNYLEIADMNEWLVDNPPRTLREACQFVAHFQGVDRTYFAGGALGQIDEMFRSYYERDVAAGLVTDEEAVWYFASLFFNDTHYSQLGGLSPDGSRDITSRVSFLILDATHYLGIPHNLAIRISDRVNEDLLHRSLEYNLNDGTGVCYSCNVGCEEGYAKNGYAVQLGRMRVKAGCNWTAIPGIEYPLQDVTRCNLAIALYYALQDIRNDESRSLETLWDAFVRHAKVMIDCIKDGFDWHYEKVSRNRPEIVLNLFMQGPIERNLNAAEGGVDIMNFCIDGIATPTVADSFAAIEKRITIENRMSWSELFLLLDSDYADAEPARLMLKNIERLGHPESLAEKWAVRIRDFWVEYCRIPTPKHNLKIIPGMFSHGDVYLYGNVTPATPNGRKAGEPIAHSNEPDPGFARGLDTFSPSLKANAVAKLQPGYGNSSPLHLDIDVDMLKHQGGIEALAALMQTHNEMGGTLINLNCLNKQTLLEAHEDPSKHPDLVVRVTGYSAFFSSLSPEYRQQIVDRFLSKAG